MTDLKKQPKKEVAKPKKQKPNQNNSFAGFD
jgi:hypothetical protein